ncbi:polysaccharide pyruvyl transferase family protein [Lyngbya confervoides BDU141951]|uniref:Polysaccharide pyruvyl transferase family protein n=2 Tax=Lyngbya TaxID=28073 RepID=A0ABD4T5G8_9CYAN|nr:polysaccharide pyruvyl transferase family protein [Lyngbya confervoides BDU141951]
MHHARLNICMRFHSALFAETLGVPYIAIDYTGGGKIKAFLEGEDKLNQMVSLTEIVNGIWRNRWNALIEFSCLEPNRLPD